MCLFSCLNLVEWVRFTVTAIWRTLQFVQVYEQEFPNNDLLLISGKWNSKLHFPYIDNVTIVLVMTIAGSLCMYLSARYTQISWITSKRIPLWIGFFLPISVFTQILVTICYTNIIGIWCDGIITTLSVIFAWKQYRKLNMVIQWSIVDLRVNGDIELLERHVRKKRRFNRVFTTIWIGISCMLIGILLNIISKTAQLVLRIYYHSFTVWILSDAPTDYHLDSYPFAVLFGMEGSIGIVGTIFIFIPYIGYGLCTMSVLLWRLFTGKTCYRTHFPVQLNTPLI